MTGTGLAQAIPIATSPILTRLFTPEDYGVFAIYIAIISIASIVVTGRYEMAVLLPKNDRDAFHIVALSIFLTLAISLLFLVLILIFNTNIMAILGDSKISNWLYWMPLSTMLVGVYSSISYWNVRKAQYRRLSEGRIIQTASTTVFQLSAGIAKIGSIGLVIGQITGQFLATMIIAKSISLNDKVVKDGLHKNRLIILAKKYKKFPLFLIVAQGLNTASSQAPIIFLGSIFGMVTAGYYGLIQRVIGAPMVLVANAIGEVFRQEASHAYRETGNCRKIYVATFVRLVALSIIPFSILFFSAPFLFEFIFGDAWRIAGEYAQILIPLYFFQFITSPITHMPLFAEKHLTDFLWQLTLFLLVILVFIIGFFSKDLKSIFIMFTAVYVFMYSLAFIISYKLSIKKI
jgi:O-antigen/teichoic acid export membrane protein